MCYGTKAFRGDINYALPSAEIAVMGAKGAVEILYRKDIGDDEIINKHTSEYEERFKSFVAAERGYIDDVIMPRNIRPRIAKALKLLRNKNYQTQGRSTTTYLCEKYMFENFNR